MADEVKVETSAGASPKVEVPADIQKFREKQNRFAVNANKPPMPIMEGGKEVHPNEKIEAQKEPEPKKEPKPKTEKEEPSETPKKETENDSENEVKDPVLAKRYKDLQADYTRKNQQASQKIKHLEKLITKFDKYLKKDENGEPIEWDFSELDKQSDSKKDDTPPEPTEDDWLENPKKATEMALKREKYLWKKELQAEKDAEREQTKKEREEAERINKEKAEFDAAWDDSLDRAAKEWAHADFTNLESPIQKKMHELVEEDPSLAEHPNANVIVARMAAAVLCIPPKNKNIPKDQTIKNEIGSKKILTGSPGNGSTSSNKSDIPEAIKKHREEKEKFKATGAIHFV
jgi:hypothetical protein